MEIIERLGYLMVGGVLGFILGFIVARLNEIKEEVDEIDTIVKQQREEQGETNVRSIVYNVVLLGVVLLVAYAAYASGQASMSIQKQAATNRIAICQNGQAARDIDRRLVEAVFSLATGAIDRPRESPPLTEAERDKTNAYIDKVNAFRENSYSEIQPTALCVPFVDDENFQPPPPPFPRIPK